jgi:hypothetical protein
MNMAGTRLKMSIVHRTPAEYVSTEVSANTISEV